MSRIGIVLLLLCLSLAAAAMDVAPPLRDVLYGDGTNTRQVVDIHLPPEAVAPYPVIFMIHGGGYLFGDKLFVQTVVREFVGLGYAVVTPNYRFAPRFPYPAPLQDIFCAYAWTLAHADDYGFDPTQIVLMGESAGANAAAMIAAVDETAFYLEGCAHAIPEGVRPAAAVLYYPPGDLSTCECERAKDLAALYLGLEGYDPAQEAALRRLRAEAAPLVWLDGSEPPFLIFHGTDDELIPVSESELLAERVQAAGGQARLIRVVGGDHGFFARPSAATRRTWTQAAAFLRDLLPAPP